MFKRILALCLALVFALSMFACAKDNDEETPAEENESESQQTEIETGAPFVPVTADPYDYMANDLKDFIKLGNYKGLSVNRVSSTVTDEMFDDEIETLIDEYSYYEQTTDRAVLEGDTIVADYAGFHNGVQFSGGTATKTELIASPNSGYIEGFAEAFIGKMPGEEFSFDVTFPSEYHNADLAGAEVTFVCTVHYIKGKDLIVPELNDEFVSENFNYSNIDEFLIAFRRSVESAQEYSATSEMYQELWTKVVDGAEVISYPGQEAERLYSEMRLTYEDYAEYYGTTYEVFLRSYLGKTDEDLMNLAKDYVKEDLVMYQLIKDYGIELTDEEYEAGIEFYAEYYAVTVEELITYYGEDKVKMTLLWEALMEKVLEDSIIID